MPVEAVLALLGGAVFVVVFLLSEGAMKAVAILVFIAGILISSSGLGGFIRDLATQVVSR